MECCYYLLVDKIKSWIEDFVDEDTYEVVSMERTNIIETNIACIHLPECKNKKYLFDYINSYIRGNNKDYKLNKIITYKKYNDIHNKKIKKYINTKHVVL